jgi:hypothetical protein
MLHNPGEVAQCLGDYAQAKELHVEALKIQWKGQSGNFIMG